MVEWQTRTLEGRMKRFVQVQVLSGALFKSMSVRMCFFYISVRSGGEEICVFKPSGQEKTAC